MAGTVHKIQCLKNPRDCSRHTSYLIPYTKECVNVLTDKNDCDIVLGTGVNDLEALFFVEVYTVCVYKKMMACRLVNDKRQHASHSHESFKF
jgi:hypothetical protein